jgi:hypothetical protein
VHHADYLTVRHDRALCGVALENPTAATGDDVGEAVCPACEARLVEYHLRWWRETALTATAELEKLRAESGQLHEGTSSDHSETTFQQDVTRTSSAGVSFREEPAGSQVDERPEAEPASLLDRARRELSELCRQFDGTVPYWRLKNTMQDFNDGLESDQRVLLAEQISADGSLIRWATIQVETRGWQVTNSPVHENSERMWEEWLQDSHQPPKKTKKRFGRSRSHDS